MGAAGDMLCSALWGLIKDKKSVCENINKLNIPDTKINFSQKSVNGINGFISSVTINGFEEGEGKQYPDVNIKCADNRTLNGILDIVNSLNMPNSAKDRVKNIYAIIAQAESKAHNKPAELVHFHEVGALDAVADISAFCMLIDKLSPDVVITSAINVGGATVNCAHGTLPVPAPATQEILCNTPYYKSDDAFGELCTPTGAALLKEFTSYYGKMPPIKVEAVSRGFGKKEFDSHINCVTMYYGELACNNAVCELTCNVDDMTAEEISYASKLFTDNNALDVTVTQCVMKKGRVGNVITVLCPLQDKQKFVELIMNNTSTIGVRERLCERFVMQRDIICLNTEYGKIRVKLSNGFGAKKLKIEYDDIAKIAKNNNISFSKAKSLLENYVKNSDLI